MKARACLNAFAPRNIAPVFMSGQDVRPAEDSGSARYAWGLGFRVLRQFGIRV